MNSNIQNRIIVLADAIQRRKIEQTAPVDPLSLSLNELQEWLTTLDEDGRRELLDELNRPSEDGTVGLDLDMEGLTNWIQASTSN